MNPDEVRLFMYVTQVAVGSVAFAPVFLALRPERHAQAARALDRAPFICLLLGLLPVAGLVGGLLALGFGGMANGYLALLVLAGVLCGLGISVSGRALGQRLLAEASPFVQTLVGAALLGGATFWPAAGLVLFLTVVALGLGGWLRGRVS